MFIVAIPKNPKLRQESVTNRKVLPLDFID